MKDNDFNTYDEMVLRDLHKLILTQEETNRLLKASVKLLDAVNSKINNLLTK